MDEFFKRGLSFSIIKRPFGRCINPCDTPRSIFINTITSAPLTPSFKHILKGHEELFQYGLHLLSTLADMHLIANEEAFYSFQHCKTHKAKGPHPIESFSLHILSIDPITSINDSVWTLDVYDVLNIASCFMKGDFFTQKIIALSGDLFAEHERILIKTENGASINQIYPNKHDLISGNPLTGASNQDYLREKDFCLLGYTQLSGKEILPFTKPGFNKPTKNKSLLWRIF